MPKRKAFLFKFWLLTFFTIIVISLAAGLGLFLYIAQDLPSPEAIIARRISESTKIFDRTGQTLLYHIHGEEKRTVISWENIPDYVKWATLVSEDADFYAHRGLDLKGIARAFLKNLSRLRIAQGGSTITQQLIKNALLGSEQNLVDDFKRKIKEAVLSLEVERRFSKDQIFWMYLNQIPYGSNAYGIEAASQTFFSKPSKDLSLAQAALLATLPKAPTFYSPYGSHFEETLNRQKDILKRMKTADYLTAEVYQKALEEELVFNPPQEIIFAPHFVIMVKDYLIKKYGEEQVENGGLKVYTTLDTHLQTLAEETVTKYAEVNEKKYQAKNAALVALNPRDGQILALIGSRDYFNLENEGNFNVALALRQPGSAFKPFAYAVAFQKGYPDSTIIFDYFTEFNPECDPAGTAEKDQFGLKCYHPQNYDGRFRGPVTLRQALAQSLNVPSVKVLYLAGVEETIDLAARLGISTLEKNRKDFGLSLVLGGAEVKLLDLTSAYGVLANDGWRQTPSFILKIEDANGNILEEYLPREEKVLTSGVARLLTSILSDNFSRTPIFGPNSSLYFPERSVAAKTGTTQENRDAWVIGYTPSLSVGVWVGNNDNTSMTKEGAGISAAGPLWHEFIAKALADQLVEKFSDPDPVEQLKMMLNGQYLPPSSADTEPRPTIHNLLYYVDKKNPLGDYPLNPETDPQFKNWEWAVLKNNGSSP